ncbi:hypothetical protein [Oceanobacillus chungangensis]
MTGNTWAILGSILFVISDSILLESIHFARKVFRITDYVKLL